MSIFFFFSIFSGVGIRFASDDDDDEDGYDDDNDNDDDDDDDDDDNDDSDDEDDDDDEWLLCCNCNISFHLASWFNNELIISSLNFNCFRRK